MSKALPTNGSKRGPGGSGGKLEFLLADLHAMMRGTNKTVPYKAKWRLDGMVSAHALALSNKKSDFVEKVTRKILASVLNLVSSRYVSVFD
jgi:hypothetical protein